MDAVSTKLACEECGRPCPVASDNPAKTREAALKLRWTFECDPVTKKETPYCPDCSADRQRLTNEGGPPMDKC